MSAQETDSQADIKVPVAWKTKSSKQDAECITPCLTPPATEVGDSRSVELKTCRYREVQSWAFC